MEWDKVNEEIKSWNWIVLLFLSLFSFFILSPSQTLGTIVGGFLIITNFNIFQNTLQKAFGNKDNLKSKRFSIIFKFYFRFIALGLIMAVLVLNRWVDPYGLALGLSTFVLAIIAFGISIVLKTKGREVS